MSAPPKSRGPRPYARAHGPLRWLLVGLGVLLSVIAAIGAFLPVLPTTPFLLLAGACFARSSPRFHTRLKRTPIFGIYVEQWEHDHSVPAHAKRKAYGMSLLAFSYSVWVVDSTGLRALLVFVGLALAGFIAKLPTTEETDTGGEPGQELDRNDKASRD